MAAPELSPCAELVRAGDPDRFLSALTAPAVKRERLFTLYAFNLEVARTASVVSEPMIGEIRLQWWRDSIEQIYAGAPIRKHEVVEPLAALIDEAGLPRAPFDALITARSFDLYKDAFADRNAFDMYLADTSGGLMELAARALAPNLAGEGAKITKDIGSALGAAALIRALPVLLSRGAAPLPTELITDRNALMEGTSTPALSSFINSISGSALKTLKAARQRKVNRSAIPAIRAGWRAPRILKLAAKPGFDPFHDLADESEFSRRLSLIWRTARRTW